MPQTFIQNVHEKQEKRNKQYCDNVVFLKDTLKKLILVSKILEQHLSQYFWQKKNLKNMCMEC